MSIDKILENREIYVGFSNLGNNARGATTVAS